MLGSDTEGEEEEVSPPGISENDMVEVTEMQICDECGYEHCDLRCPACMPGSSSSSPGSDTEGEEQEEHVEMGIITVSEDEDGPELGTAIAEEPGTAVAEEPGTAVIVMEGPGTAVAEEPGTAVIEEGPGTAVIVIEEPTSVGWFDPASRRWRRWQRGSLAPVTVTNPEA